jgi:hypothetical protein
MENEPPHQAHQHKCCSENDQKGSGVENHWATFFTARSMRAFGPPAMAALINLTLALAPFDLLPEIVVSFSPSNNAT